MGSSLATQCAPFVGGETHKSKSKSKSKITDYAFHQVLGEGAFGKVCAATDRCSAEEVAVKIVRTAGLSRDQRLKAQAEVELWRTIPTHPNIVGLRGSFMERHCLFIVMERCQCTVTNLLRKDYAAVKNRASWYMREMLQGVLACHQAMLAHRDIKPDNFLVGDDGIGIKLCDFGLSAKVPRHGLRDRTGTVPFMSPEMLSGRGYGLGTDIWSFAVMAYAIIFEEFPYILQEMTAEAAKTAVMEGGSPKKLQGVTQMQDKTEAAFLLSLLQREPDRRASAGEALEHPFLQAGPPVESQQADSESKTEDTLAPLEGDDLQDDGDGWGDSATTSIASTRQSS